MAHKRGKRWVGSGYDKALGRKRHLGTFDTKKEASQAEADRLIYHVENHKKRKPMTLEEAVLQMDDKRDYLVYRDAQTDRVVMLVRRRDGHFDLVEA